MEVFYLHGPDRSTLYEVALKTVNDLYKEGKFRRFGISNYMSCVVSPVVIQGDRAERVPDRWEVAQIAEMRKANGYV